MWSHDKNIFCNRTKKCCSTSDIKHKSNQKYVDLKYNRYMLIYTSNYVYLIRKAH